MSGDQDNMKSNGIINNMTETKSANKISYPDDAELFDLVCKAVKFNTESTLPLEKPAHKFILPPELRKELITPAHFKKHYKYFLRASDDSNIELGIDAISDGIDFLFSEQDDIDGEFQVDSETGRRPLALYDNICAYCNDKKVETVYGIADKIKEVSVSWFHCEFQLCESCYNFPELFSSKEKLENQKCFKKGVLTKEMHLKDNSQSVLEREAPSILDQCILKDLVFIVVDYLRPVYNMDRHDNIGVKVRETSTLTEWLCLWSLNLEEYSAICFINCNPESRFYGYLFVYEHQSEYLNIDPIHITQLISLYQ